MVGWMNLNTPTVTRWRRRQRRRLLHEPDARAAVVGLTRSVPRLRPDARHPRTASRSTVKGTIPLLANFGEWGLGDHLTMPDDWAKWANRRRALVVDHSTADYVTNWDIHDQHRDDAARSSRHRRAATQSTRPDLRPTRSTRSTTAPLDACDRSVARRGGFSTVFGTQSRANNTIGPFDPLYPHDTHALRRQPRRG